MRYTRSLSEQIDSASPTSARRPTSSFKVPRTCACRPGYGKLRQSAGLVGAHRTSTPLRDVTAHPSRAQRFLKCSTVETPTPSAATILSPVRLSSLNSKICVSLRAPCSPFANMPLSSWRTNSVSAIRYLIMSDPYKTLAESFDIKRLATISYRSAQPSNYAIRLLASCRLIDKSMPRTVDIRWRIRIEGLATPRSNWETYVRSTSACKARASWDNPSRRRDCLISLAS